MVQFDNEDATAVVPLSRIKCTGLLSNIKEGDCVLVLWHNNKQYEATFVLSGEFTLHYLCISVYCYCLLLLGSRDCCDYKQKDLELDDDTDKEYETNDGEQDNGKAIDGNGNEASMESGAKESDNSNDREQKNDKAIDGMGNEASMENGAKESDNSNGGEQNNSEAIDDRGNEDSMESRTVSIRFHHNAVLWKLSYHAM